MNKETLLKMGVKAVKKHIPSLNDDVYVKELSYAGAIASAKAKDSSERVLTLIVYTLCDENGVLLFTEEDKEQVANTFSYLTLNEIAIASSDITNKTPPLVK
ncbi:TPA: hypothetical protein PMC50_002515 [Vibrio cholerae]|nr:hypothetical protein [Vibrio cholerae]